MSSNTTQTASSQITTNTTQQQQQQLSDNNNKPCMAFNQPLKPLMPHTDTFVQESAEYILHVSNPQATIDKINEIDAGVQKNQRQLKLLNTRLNDAIEEVDTYEVTTLPTLADKCNDLEQVFEQIDSLYLLVEELGSAFDRLEARCDEVEKYQGSSASKLKSVGLFFKSVLKQDEAPTKLDCQPDCVANLPKIDDYVAIDYEAARLAPHPAQ